jgi:hypothetical protein
MEQSQNMKKLFLFALVLAPFIFLSCDEDKNARIQIWLTDDFGDYQQVNVEVRGVEIHSDQTDDGRGWKSLPASPQIYDLLKLANGEETLLGELELPGGRLSQVRLLLGENNTVMIGDVIYPLTTPSAQQSGLKINVNQVLAEGITYKILLDFHAGKSVVRTGAGSYILKPVITAVTAAIDGAIKGVIEPPRVVNISLTRDQENEPIATTSTNEEGEFLIQGLEEGTYLLVVEGPEGTPLFEKEDIKVELGEVTNLGAIAIPE